MELFLSERRPLKVPLSIAAALTLACTPAADRDATRAPAFPDAFRATSHRSFADVATWRKVFEDPARDEWQQPARVVAALRLEPGAVAVDLGAGTGYFTTVLSRTVGANGNVFAVETEPNLVAELRSRAEKEGMRNVVPVLASSDDPRVPQGVADVVMIVDTFHHIDERLSYLRRLREVLRPDGRVAVVDWKKEPLPIGPDLDHKLAREQVIYEMNAAGYRLEREPDFLRYQYFLIFRLPAE